MTKKKRRRKKKRRKRKPSPTQGLAKLVIDVSELIVVSSCALTMTQAMSNILKKD